MKFALMIYINFVNNFRELIQTSKMYFIIIEKLIITISLWLFKYIKGELRRKMNLWSDKTLVPSQPFSEICFHDNRM